MGTILYICSTVTAEVIFPLETFATGSTNIIKYIALLIKVYKLVDTHISVKYDLIIFESSAS